MQDSRWLRWAHGGTPHEENVVMMAGTQVFGSRLHTSLQDWKENCGGFPDTAVGVHMIPIVLAFSRRLFEKNTHDGSARFRRL